MNLPTAYWHAVHHYRRHLRRWHQGHGSDPDRYLPLVNISGFGMATVTRRIHVRRRFAISTHPLGSKVHIVRRQLEVTGLQGPMQVTLTACSNQLPDTQLLWDPDEAPEGYRLCTGCAFMYFSEHVGAVAVRRTATQASSSVL